MEKEKKQKVAKAVYITDSFEEKLKTFSEANNRKYKPGTEIYILAQIGLKATEETIEEAMEYKEKIKSALKKHDEFKVRKASALADVLEEAGIELKFKDIPK